MPALKLEVNASTTLSDIQKFVDDAGNLNPNKDKSIHARYKTVKDKSGNKQKLTILSVSGRGEGILDKLENLLFKLLFPKEQGVIVRKVLKEKLKDIDPSNTILSPSASEVLTLVRSSKKT